MEVLYWFRMILSALCLITGVVFSVLSVFSVGRFDKALNQMHAAAIGDTLGLFFVFVGLILMRGFTMDSLKLIMVLLFFWVTSPVCGHMVSRMEKTTSEDLGELAKIYKDGEQEEDNK